MFFQGRLLKKTAKFKKKTRKKRWNFGVGKNKPKIPSKLWFGRVLGSIWGGFGTVLGLFWALLGAFGPFFRCSKINFFQTCASMGPRWAPRGLWDRFWADFSWIWGRFGKGLERNLEEFWAFEQVMGRFGKCLASFGPAVAKLLNWTPALVREASQCWALMQCYP